MSYGRISWQDLNYSMQRDVLTEYEEIDNKNHLSKDPTAAHLVTLYNTLKGLDISLNMRVSADRLPVIFQLCDRLSQALSHWSAEHRKAHIPAENRGVPRGDPKQSFRDRVIRMTKNDRGHAVQILGSALGDVIELNSTNEVWSTLAQSFADDKAWRRLRKLFTRGQMQVLLKAATKHQDSMLLSKHVLGKLHGVMHNELNADLIDAIDNHEKSYLKSRTHLLPIHRYLVGVLLRCLPPRACLDSVRAVVLEREAPKDTSEQEPARYEVVPRSRDPLTILYQDFEVSRFLTTNYDDEVESMFEYHSLAISINGSAESVVPRTDPLQPMAQMIVFYNHNAGDLVAFAVQEGTQAAGVVHLHGKAETDGDIVATEGDYQRRYMRRDETRSLVDEAIGLAFAANPILFVGSGMGEDDILRPLRQFMSSPARQGNRIALALLPALEPWHIMDQQKLTLLERYGIHAVYYGWARVGQCKKKGDERELRVEKTHAMWLPKVWAIKRALENLLNVAENTAGFFEIFLSREKLDNFHLRLMIANKEIDRELTDLQRIVCGRNGAGYEESYPGQQYRFIREQFAPSGNGEPRAQLMLQVPTEIEGLVVTSDGSGEISIRLEVDLLNATIQFVRRLVRDFPTKPSHDVVSPGTDDNCIRWRVAFKAHRTALTGSGDGIIAAFMCARLQRAHAELEMWNDYWFKIPEPRAIETVRSVEPFHRVEDFVFVERHSLHLDVAEDTGLQAEEHRPRRSVAKYTWQIPAGRFCTDAPSQAFNSFRSAIVAQQDTIRSAVGQRVFLLIARRGIGKGHFFAAFQSRKRGGHLEQFFRALEIRGVRWCGAAFFNLAFSHEIGSVFDRVAQFLYEFLRTLSIADAQRYERDWFQVRDDRLGQLDFVLKSIQAICSTKVKGGSANGRRILIAINGLNILFDSDGNPKNEQISRWFDILLSPRECGWVPVDLVLVCGDSAVPRYFRRDAGLQDSLPLVPAIRTDISEKGRRAIDERSRRLDLNLCVDETKARKHSETNGSLAVVHFLHAARASLLASVYFPEAALTIARGVLAERPGSGGHGKVVAGDPRVYDANAIKSARRTAVGLLDEITQKITLMQPQGDGFVKLSRNLKLLIPMILLAEVRVAPASENSSKRRDLWVTAGDALRTLATIPEARVTGERKGIEESFATCLRTAYNIDDAVGGDVDEFINDARRIDTRMKELYETLGSGRFAFTLLMAAVSEIAVPWSVVRTARESGNPTESGPFDRAAEEAVRFVNEVRREAKAVTFTHRADFVIGKVLRKLKERHAVRSDLPLTVPTPLLIRGTGKELFDLQEVVLWQLAVIGQPVEVDVLARCPLVRSAAEKVMGGGEAVGSTVQTRMVEYEHVVEWTLDLLVFRCLVHRLKPAPNPHVSELGKFRFALHRLVQRHVLQRLGAPFIEYPDADDLAPTLYASQPRNLTRLSVTDHADLQETVAALSGYPNARGREWLFSEEPPEATELGPGDDDLRRRMVLNVQKRMLRAAIGIVRSVYSVPVVTRLNFTNESLDPHNRFDDSSVQVSILEDHSQQVRWLLRQAIEVQRALSRGKFAQPASEKRYSYAPFYREEIVSLYNECDLFGLIQGRVSDAAEPFERALEAVKRIEPHESGPLHKRILLNAAVRDIERGRLSVALATLKRIVASEEHEAGRFAAKLERRNPPVREDAASQQQSPLSLIATGYLGLVAHLSGDSPRAHDLYGIAYEGLGRCGDSRAASIFARHWSDLLRREGVVSRTQAESMAAVSLNLARDCGHEDIRHMALISQAKLNLLQEDLKQYAQIHLELNAIDRYGRVIGMQRLECDVAEVRALAHANSGDMVSAGALATRSLEIATQCDLRIRKIKLLGLLARINGSRGEPAAAVPILKEAMELARGCGWNLGLSNAQRQMNGIVEAGAGL